MAKILAQDGPSTGSGQAALSYIQEAVTIFRETGSRHLPDAERTLLTIQDTISKKGEA